LIRPRLAGFEVTGDNETIAAAIAASIRNAYFKEFAQLQSRLETLESK
jgi:hypothetical protein